MEVAAVILCGGKGSRMLAGGEETHKPLLKVGGVPSTKFVIDKLTNSGLNFSQIIVVVPTNRESEYHQNRVTLRKVKCFLMKINSSLSNIVPASPCIR